MRTKPPKNLIFPVRYVTAPEFRAANTTVSTAYSGPEQRNRAPRYLHDNAAPPATGRRTGTAAAA